MLDLIGTGRPAGDILSRVVRISLAGIDYVLPTLAIAGNRRWKAQLDARLSGLLDGLTEGGNDIEALFGVLSRQVDDLLDLLVSYDTSGVLPSREELEETIHEDELLDAVREVWRAANPLVVTVLREGMMTALSESGSSAPTSSPRPSTAGRPRRSKKH
jgi:hypothetical protein